MNRRPTLLRSTGSNKYGVNFNWLYSEIGNKKFRNEILFYFFSKETDYLQYLEEESRTQILRLRAIFKQFIYHAANLTK